MQNENEHTYDNGFHPKEVHLKAKYKFYNQNIFFRFFGWLTVLFTRLWLIFPRFFMGVKTIGRKNKRKVKGAVMVSNHIHPLDAFFLAATVYGRKVYVTMLESNLGFGIVSRYMRMAAAVPIPTERRQLRRFSEDTEKTLKKGKNILFYPEAALMPYCDHIRNFLPGAFHYAVSCNAPIMPCCFTFHKPKGIQKLFRRKKPVVHCNFLEPYFITPKETRKETIEATAKEVHDIIEAYFIKHSDYYYKDGKKIEKETQK
ncbi:MAG: 1-acyl-sn-glycerol-3-phosphate acyltransferase [Anaeroplasmataceae bacterium]|nr:1-acyl-sn-glycerol-3-phosphate acyltransferase [Anaeroplasmataceae bacterium]MDE6414218.1 1-acyl-sn-glycerol-3-phosphate acyltransferase [Anaeroplasmataceae bacterium]